MSRFDGVEEGMSKPEVQNWVPKPYSRHAHKKGKRNRTQGELIFLALNEFFKKDILRAYDGDKALKMGIDYDGGNDDIIELMKTYEICYPDGTEASREDISKMIERWIKEYRQAWNSVRGGSVGFGHLNTDTATKTKIKKERPELFS